MVIVILLIGILSIIRLFPPGFLINRWTDDQTRAGRLALLEADRLRATGLSLPEAVIPVNIVNSGSGFSFTIDTGASPDDLSEAVHEPSGQFPWWYYHSGPNKGRRVIGETVRIPFPSPLGADRGSIYLLSLGPFMDVYWDGQTRSIFIQGGPMTRDIEDSTAFDQTSGRDFTRPSGFLRSQYVYGVDYSKRQVCFLPATFDREFLMTFSFYNASNVIETHVDEVIAVPAGTDSWITIPNIPVGSGEIVGYSETVGRKFKDIGFPPPAWSPNNPYEFYVASPKIGNLGNVGEIVFNPNGREFTEQTNIGPQPLTAHIDYDVADWHIIHEDRSMPASSPYVVPLSLRGIKALDDVEADQSIYQGLFYGVPKGQNAGDFIIYDVTNGNQVPPVDPVTNLENYHVNYKDGIVTFHNNFGDANRTGTFRFYYQAHGDWALQLQKAAGLYNRVNSAALGFASYWLGDGTNGSMTTRVYFPRSEAGKTVNVREVWYLDSGGVSHRLANKTYRIKSSPAEFQSIGPYQLTYVDIADDFAAGDPLRPANFDYQSTGQPLLGVQGVSLRSRVIWRNGGAVNQSGGDNVFSSRWRKVDVDTIMGRTPAQ